MTKIPIDKSLESFLNLLIDFCGLADFLNLELLKL